MADKHELLAIEGELATAVEFALKKGPEALKAKRHVTDLSNKLADMVDENEFGDICERLIQLDLARARERHILLEEAWQMVGTEHEATDSTTAIEPDIEQQIDVLLKLMLTGQGGDPALRKITELGHGLAKQIGASNLHTAIARLVALDPKHSNERFDLLTQAWAMVA